MNDARRTDVIGQLGPLRRYARSLTRDEAQAEDLVQVVSVFRLGDEVGMQARAATMPGQHLLQFR